MTPRDDHELCLVGRAAEVRAMDAATIEGLELPGRVLMELAGAGTAALIADRTGGVAGRAVILCGGGNNGGDGYVIARHLMDRGWTARCVATGDPARLRGEAGANHALLTRLGGEVTTAWDDRTRSWLAHADVIVDALFGTGLARAIEGRPREVIDYINERGARGALRVAVDLPSGVAADTGAVLGCAFRADLTATFGLPKPGLFMYPGRELAGEVRTVNIAMPRAVVDDVGATVRWADDRAVARLIPPRPADGHKGTFGHVGVVGGLAGKQGAGVLAGLGALYGGAGLVTWHADDAGAGGVPRPAELMFHPLERGLEPRVSVIVAGPGLGTDDVATRALELVLAKALPVVLDADALNLIAAQTGDFALPADGDAVLTPHPAEAARLLAASTPVVQADRLAAAAELVDKTGCVVVLKGASTIVQAPREPAVIIGAGDASLAQGGSGDVLAGLIGALRAQGLSPQNAAIAGAWLHGRAGEVMGHDRARRGVLASEVAQALPGVVDGLLASWR